MTLQQLRQKLEFLFSPDNEIGLSMYFILKSDSEFSIRKADISSEVRDTLRDQFLNYIKDTFIANDDLSLTDISVADNRKNVVHYFDLDELPVGFEVMGELLDDEDKELFNFNADSFDNIFAFVFLLGNESEKIAIYKKQYPINLLKRDSILRIYKSEERLVKLKEDIISLNEKFDFMQLDEDIIVVKLATLEKFFNFQDVVIKAATANLKIIEKSKLIADITTLQEMTGDLRFARRLMRVKANSRVLSLPFTNISAFIKQHPKLKRSMRFNDDETKITLDTKVSKDLFLRLLNDNYLKSELTDFLYETDNKDLLGTD